MQFLNLLLSVAIATVAVEGIYQAQYGTVPQINTHAAVGGRLSRGGYRLLMRAVQGSRAFNDNDY